MSEPDPAWFEREYNTRLAIPDAAALCAAWPERAAATRRRHAGILDIRYGEHPREVFDLFRAEEPRGTVLFIHGGYWRAFSKDDFSWVAEDFLAHRVSVAVLNYPLCPDVRLGRIVEATRAAFVHLHRSVLSTAERRRIVVTGHSAGGYLAALHLATDWTAFGLPDDPVVGVLPISGVFDLAPLIRTSMNEALRLDAAEAETLDLSRAPLRSRARLAFALGGDESAEFHRQSAQMARRWRASTLLDVEGRHHLDVIDGLAEPGSTINRLILDWI